MDLLSLVSKDTQLKRVASTKGGEYAGACPFCGGRDRFRVWPNAERPGWWCRQCQKHGDAIAYLVMRGDITTQEAYWLRHGEDGAPRPTMPRKTELRIPDDDELQTQAMQVAIECAAILWEPEGERARVWLHARGLKDETLKAHLVGFNPRARELHGLFVPRGITLPHWQESTNTLYGIKVRLATNGRDKYRSVAGSRPSLYLADNLLGRDVAVICEGEFDALLLAQEAGDLVGVCALGSASNKRTAIDAGLPYLLPVKRLLVATDNDKGGEEAAACLMERTRRALRLKVPEGNDVTDFWKAGGDLRAWVLAGLEEHAPDPMRDVLDDPLVQAAIALGGVVTQVLNV